jgi:biopolymer transport protein ExbB/TolQ
MFSYTTVSNTLRTVASALQTPVAVILLLLLALTVVMLGTLIAEGFTERLRLKAKLPQLADELKAGARPLAEIIGDSGLLRRQRAALLEVTRHPDLTPAMRESMAVNLLSAEREHYEGIVRITDLIARLGPMFGLLGTLIPLGPGIIALGRGDTYTLSTSLLTAFDTTIAGLVAAAVAFLISAVRKKWYARYLAGLEMSMECLLDVLEEGQYAEKAQ